MKRVKYLLFVIILLVGLTGCNQTHRRPKQISLYGEELPDAEGSSEGSSSNQNTEYKVDKLGERENNLSWIGKYSLNDAENKDVFVEMTLEAGSDIIIFDVTSNMYNYDNPNEDGFSSVTSSYFSVSLSDIDKDLINFSDDTLGISFKIEKVEDGIKIEVLNDQEGTHSYINGIYSRYNDGTSIKGYYGSSNGEVAITPVGGNSARVSSKTLVDGEYYLYSQIYTVSNGSLKYDAFGEEALIEKTSDGIKITTEILGLQGKYELEK